MHFNLVTVRLWSGFYQAPSFEVRHLLEGSTYSDLSINGVALIRGRGLFEARPLLEEIH